MLPATNVWWRTWFTNQQQEIQPWYAEHVAQWCHAVFDDAYLPTSAHEDPTFNLTGRNSAVTLTPLFPAGEMKQYLPDPMVKRMHVVKIREECWRLEQLDRFATGPVGARG